MPSIDPSLSIAQRIDLACDRFEAEWKSGKHPNIADYVSAAPNRTPKVCVKLYWQLNLSFKVAVKPILP